MLCIENIGELVLVPPGPVPGRAMKNVACMTNAAMLIDQDEIAWLGPMQGLDRPDECEVIDAGGGCVLPGLIDCHTHAVFAGTREREFVQRIEGKTYAEIAESGGGIRVTVEAVRNASRNELVELALPRLKRMFRNGVTTVEIKSGYGLNVADEIKMLEAVNQLQTLQLEKEHAVVAPMELVPTYLAAHTTPREYADDPNAYLDEILDDKVLTRIREEGLAEFCDVFCERTAFDLEQSRRVLTTAGRFGLTPKLHADQITQMGATVLAGEVGAISADHLETINDEGMAAMKRAGTVAVLLPACSFFLGVRQAPARKLIEADLPVAVATDYNPGSSMVESLPLAMHIACTQMRMTPMEVLVAATANAAAAINRHDRLGAIKVGHQADLLILDVANHARFMYEPGRNCVQAVIKKGKVVLTVS